MKKIIAGIIASAALAGAASATVITTSTQTINFGGTTDFNQSSNFSLFDSTLGTLLSVTIADSYGFTSTVTVTNQAASASSGYARTESTLTIGSSDSNINSAFTDLLGGGNALDLTGGKVNYSLASGGSTSGSSNVATNNYSATTSLAQYLAYFSAVGGGTANVFGSTFTSTVQQNTGGNSTSSQVTSGQGSFSIYYTYDNSTAGAVPEPATWVMMIGGFGLVGYGLRRRGASVVFN